MDYSIYDARKAGFGGFLIREEMQKQFEEQVEAIRGNTQSRLCFQNKNDLPNGFVCHRRGNDRGVLGMRCGHSSLRRSFAVINADDYYGAETFEVLVLLQRWMIRLEKIYSLWCFVCQKRWTMEWYQGDCKESMDF